MLRVRPYRKDDAKTIVTWCKDEETFYKWTAGIMGKYPLTIQRLEEATCGRIDNDRYFPFVAVDDEHVVGFFILRHPGEVNDELRFGFVIVDPQIRGKGYGKKMLQLGLKFAFEVYGVTKVSLGVFENNPNAYHCYHAVGFRETGEEEWYEMGDGKWKCIEMEIFNYSGKLGTREKRNL
ncbi:MAG: GNAT family N-acetyltransferase [Lachnospiraceae bacterium]|nr:GNAT family N-acetyltransferase [Lachnospiraceae bacterium]